MQRPEQPVLRDIVLLGGGHSHVAVLRRFAMHPLPGVRLTLICRDTHTPYSGMLPGYIAGHYAYDEVHIDLARLAAFAGARFFRDEAIGIDRTGCTVQCRDRPPVAYDRLSINIGATPQLQQVDGAAEHAVAVKPINRFNDRWLALLSRVRAHTGTGPLRIAVVGGGAGGVELILAMQYRLHNELRALSRDPSQLRFELLTRDTDILLTHPRRVRRIFERTLVERGIGLHLCAPVNQVCANQLVTESGNRFDADEVIWVTQAGGARWLRNTGLELDERDCVLVTDTLQSLSDERVFAAGDVATMVNHPREKAGVFAVRQGPPLAGNLRRSVLGRKLRGYRPQRRWLALITTGDRHAVASRGAFGFEGDWVWRWKNHIDRRFMARFNELPFMDVEADDGHVRPVALSGQEEAEASAASAMRCGGCGAKVGADSLFRVLSDLVPDLAAEDGAAGSPDDAATVAVPPGRILLQSVDFFRAFIDDPYVFGQVAANHALNDIYAMGADPLSALAIVTLPPGLSGKVEQTLYQLLSGALRVLDNAGCALTGGHTGEGAELALGFTVNGTLDANDRLLRKHGLNDGDALVLTKQLGTGTLLAAHARGRARGRWIDAALDAMCQSNQRAARCLRAHDATACTDVTGFGLAGHLVEMLDASQAGAKLCLSALPALDGAEDTGMAGLLSSLHASNQRVSKFIEADVTLQQHRRVPLLYDPQTAGGLLAGVPPARATDCVNALHGLGYQDAAVIGHVTVRRGHAAPVTLQA